VLSQELYEQIPEEDLTAQEQAAQEEWEAEVRERESYFRLPEGDDPESVRRRTDPDRWRGVWRTAASEETEEAVKTVWPDRSIAFQVNMGLLWQSRIEDGTPVPATTPPPATQLRARRASKDAREEMEQLVLAELRRQRLPAR